MITGFNTDIKHRGQVYHIQTEDKGMANPVIESLVYKGGEILGTRRSSYKNLVDEGFSERELTRLMEEQHKRVIFDIQHGRLDVAKDGITFDETNEDRTLDELVMDYLRTMAQQEKLRIKLPDSFEVLPGYPSEFVVSTRRHITLEPVPGAKVSVILHTAEKSLSLFTGTSDKFGKITARFTVPANLGAEATLVVSAQSEQGSDELKHTIRPAR